MLFYRQFKDKDFTPLVYIAVPKKGSILFTKRWKNLCHLLRRLELGLLLVTIKKDYSCVKRLSSPLYLTETKVIVQPTEKGKH